MWNRRWQDAVDFFSVLEDIYGELSRYPLTDVPFSRKYTKESILEVPQVYEPYGLQIVGGIAPWATPVRRKVVVDDEEAAQKDSTHCFYIFFIHSRIQHNGTIGLIIAIFLSYCNIYISDDRISKVSLAVNACMERSFRIFIRCGYALDGDNLIGFAII